MNAFRRRAAALLLVPLLLAACDSAEERVRAHHERGLSYAAERRPELAAVEFASALRIDDGFLPARMALAEACRALARPSCAATHFRHVAEAEPENAGARLGLARTLLELGDAEAAAPHAETALRLLPDSAEARALSAAVAWVRGDAEAALAAARAALEADPAEPLARLVLVSDRVRAGDPQGALAQIDAAGKAAPDSFAFALIRIRLLERLGDREAVGAALTRLSALYPENESVRLAIARWMMQGDPPDLAGAEAELRAVAARDPDDPAHALRVVDFLVETRGSRAARAELERLVAAPDAPPVFVRALAAHEAQAGEIPAAIARMERAAEGPDPAEADRAKLMLARLRDAETGGGAAAAALIDEVLARDSGNVEALALRAALRMRADDHDAAVADLRAALDGAPEAVELHEMLAEAHARNGAPELALERRALAVRLSGRAPGPSMRLAGQLMSEGRAESAESVLRDALRASPRDRALLTALVRTRLWRADWSGALAAVDALEAAGADPSFAARLEAAAHDGRGRIGRALDVLEESWRVSGDRADLAALAETYVRAGDADRAEALLAARLEETPGDAVALGVLAGLRARAGADAEAEALLRRAAAAAPDDAGTHDALIRFLRARGDDAGADAALAAALARLPDAPSLRFREALRRERAGDPEGAIALYETLHREAPGDPLVANNLASLLAEHRDDPASLMRAANVARRLRGSPVPAFLDTYGWTLLRAGDAAGAVAALRDSAAALPGSPTAQHHLAEAWRALGREAEAREAWRRALELAEAGAPFPKRVEAEAALAALEAEAADRAASATARAGKEAAR